MGMKKEITVGHGSSFKEPQQTYVILNKKRGFIFYSPIFCRLMFTGYCLLIKYKW